MIKSLARITALMLFFSPCFAYGAAAPSPPVYQPVPQAQFRPAQPSVLQPLHPVPQITQFTPRMIQLPGTITMTGMKFQPYSLSASRTLEMTGLKFYPHSLTASRTLEMTGLRFHPQSLTPSRTLEMTGMNFHDQTIAVPATLEMTGMLSSLIKHVDRPVNVLTPIPEKRKLP